MKQINLILVDDNSVFRNALKSLLINEFNVNVLHDTANAKDLWDFQNINKADVVLMDILMPEIDGFTMTKEILKKYHDLKIIAITMHTERVYLDILIEAGFKGCIFKNKLMAEFEKAMQAINSGKLFFPPDLALTDPYLKSFQ